MNGAGGPGGSVTQTEGFEDTVRDFWVSRPRRPYRGRKVAGVAAALGNRYGIDPIVIRVALVALMVFGGFGLPAYLLGWLLFPVEDDEVSAFESLLGNGHSSVSKAFTLILCLALIPVSGWAFTSHWLEGGSFLGLALLFTALYLLHHTRGDRNRPVPVVSAATTGSNIYPGAPTMTTSHGVGSPAEDPLGAAPLGWDLPEPSSPELSQPPTPPRSRRSAVGFVTFGVALVVAGVGGVLAMESVPWFTPEHVIGLVLGVLGTGMVLGAFLGGGRGLIGLAIPLSLAGILLTMVPITDFAKGTDSIEATPHTADEVPSEYERTAGRISLDLRELADHDSVTTDLHTSVGEVVVTVPENADLTYTCETSMGQVDCLGQEKSGIGVDPISGDTVSEEGNGPDITLNATTIVGSVEVRRV